MIDGLVTKKKTNNGMYVSLRSSSNGLKCIKKKKKKKKIFEFSQHFFLVEIKLQHQHVVNSKSSVINVSVQVWSKSIHLFKDIAVDLRDVGLEN